MGLPALEFSDCYLDSPHFRDRLKSHELELDKTNKFIKELIKDGKALIQALKNLSTAKRKFAESLNEFKFQCIGDAETDDEICIAKSLQEFAGVLQNLEDERTRMIENASDVLITPLERFRKEQISAAKEAKKKYDKETEKYCAVIEKHLGLSAKKKEAQLHEADAQVDQVRQHFYEVSLEYVFKVQEVQERKMFDFVEPFPEFNRSASEARDTGPGRRISGLIWRFVAVASEQSLRDQWSFRSASGLRRAWSPNRRRPGGGSALGMSQSVVLQKRTAMFV
ncbi:hypothetical protein DPEC_G00226700 [Dallia pectoralis]|uniref:Uncharacterized protein n=1 Tax=Dallia pectoralis TaxID=75939 RepID=A0ACC2G0N7_DALPE|nr:hypothetical protein DPEC_G00226700 [Dallia pectoralis]